MSYYPIMMRIIAFLIVAVVLTGLGVYWPRILTSTADEQAFSVTKVATNTIDNYARMVNAPHGVYDERTNRTYIAFSGGVGADGLSAASPYITFFDHVEQKWLEPVRVFSVTSIANSHYYPQVLVDDSGYIHVFHTFHYNNDILHATSRYPADITEWDISFLEGTDRATYGVAFKAKNGDLYLFYRESASDSYPLWRESEVYLKSIDNGKTWTKQILIDPLAAEDKWGTIYVKGVHYQESPEGLHIVFAPHAAHNKAFNKHYYVFFSFNDDKLYSVTGQELGLTITRDIFDTCCLLLDYGFPLNAEKLGNTHVAVGIDADRKVHVLMNYFEYPATRRIAEFIWNGKQWNRRVLYELGQNVNPYILENRDGVLYLYAIADGRRVVLYKKNIAGQWKLQQNIFETVASDKRLHQLATVTNGRMEIFAAFFEGGMNTQWQKPFASGKFFIISAVK